MSIRPSCTCAACSSVNVNLYDFLRLHGSHNNAKFDNDSFPFNFLGFLWSTCMKSEYGGTYPQPRQRSLSRFANASRASGTDIRFSFSFGFGDSKNSSGGLLPVVRPLGSRRRPLERWHALVERGIGRDEVDAVRVQPPEYGKVVLEEKCAVV